MTLSQYVKSCGSQRAAADEIGVSWLTAHRWLHGLTAPDNMGRLRLKSLGIEGGYKILDRRKNRMLV